MRSKNTSISNQVSTNIAHAENVHIANTINIQNFEIRIDELIQQVDNEPNLTTEQKKNLCPGQN